MVASGNAEIGIATETLSLPPQLVTFRYYDWSHGIIVPKGHELERIRPITLEAITEHPIITYHDGFTGRGNIDRAFEAAGLSPDIVMSAMDTDVLKTYVALGLGVGIIAFVSFQDECDRDLRFVPVANLFPTNTTWIAVRRGGFLREFAYRFIALCSPDLDETTVKRKSHESGEPVAPPKRVTAVPLSTIK
jgi:LysR family cys regulon transcriptional activator